MPVIALLLFLSLAAQDARQPAPPPAEQKRAEKELRDLLKKDFAKTDRASKRALGRKLLGEAVETKGDPVTRYAMLALARDLAADTADVRTSFGAIARLAGFYDVKAEEMRATAASTARKRPIGAEETVLLGEDYLAIVEESCKTADFDAALRAAREAESIAKSAKNAALAARAADALKEIPDLRKEQDAAGKAELGLSVNPDDPEANSTLGHYLCFTKNDWEKGLPCLQKAADTGVREAATVEASRPAEPGAQVKLAEAWWVLSAKAKGALEKKRYQARAVHWFGTALPGLSGVDKLRAWERLKAAGVIPRERSADDFIVSEFEDPKDFAKWMPAGTPAPTARSGKGAMAVEGMSEEGQQMAMSASVPPDASIYRYLMLDVLIPNDKVDLTVAMGSGEGSYYVWNQRVGGDGRWQTIKLDLKSGLVNGTPSLNSIKMMAFFVKTPRKIALYVDNVVFSK